MIKVCLVDDHKIVREGVKRILSESNDIVVTDEADTGEAFLEMLKRPRWDIVILDIALPAMSGIDVLRHVHSKHPVLPVLILSMYEEDQYGFRVFESGASGYLAKSRAPEELLSAIRKVAAGGKYVSPEFAEKLVSALGKPKRNLHDTLSKREFETLLLIAKGVSNSGISQTLSLSPKTTSTFRVRILKKLNLESNADIVRYCMQHQLIE